MSAVDFRQRVRELARLESSGSPVVSVYLNTEWVDEHQRERVRIFVKNALADIVDDTPPALIVFADGVSARLIALDASGVTGETVLEAEVPGRHESGGWADLAQSRYERHILEHREQHFAAVAAAIGAWTERHDAHHIVLAAEPRSAAALRKHLPDSVAARIAGVVAGARHESSPVIADRAAGVLASGGEVTTLESHRPLAGHGGVVARLRYAA